MSIIGNASVGWQTDSSNAQRPLPEAPPEQRSNSCEGN